VTQQELFEPKKAESGGELLTVNPVIDYSVRGLCAKPYHGHKKGCPNVGKKEGCPPNAQFFDRYFDLAKPVYAIVNEFDLGTHTAKMKEKHPEWSQRQLVCCLYWQGRARKKLKEKILKASSQLPQRYQVTACPEAMGVNITATLSNVGIVLEWPPVKIVRQVALFGVKK
jgi:predicted metal-binding protein